MAKKTAQTNTRGRLFFGKDVLTQVITLAVNEISGVMGITSKNFRFVLDGYNMKINLNLSLNYGHAACDVAFRVQENIKRSIETMTDYKVGVVNVHILSVGLEEEN